jgi:hypothetical protein
MPWFSIENGKVKSMGIPVEFGKTGAPKDSSMLQPVTPEIWVSKNEAGEILLQGCLVWISGTLGDLLNAEFDLVNFLKENAHLIPPVDKPK